MGKAKISINEKLNTIHQILSGKESVSQAAVRLSLDPSSVDEWMVSYKSCGEDVFIQKGNNHYSEELKKQAVTAYLSGEGSLRDICEKYGIRRKTQLRQWIKKYNGHEELKASGTGGTIIMAKGRKTLFEERIEIVQYCISHDRNYAETARQYNVYIIKSENKELELTSNGDFVIKKELAENYEIIDLHCHSFEGLFQLFPPFLQKKRSMSRFIMPVCILRISPFLPKC